MASPDPLDHFLQTAVDATPENRAKADRYFRRQSILRKIRELRHLKSKPEKKDIVEVMGGHVCRCTGYKLIYDAFERAAKFF